MYVFGIQYSICAIYQFNSFLPITKPVVNYTMNIQEAKAEFSDKIRNASERYPDCKDLNEYLCRRKTKLPTDKAEQIQSDNSNDTRQVHSARKIERGFKP